MRVLVTGGLGVIGSRIARLLMLDGHEVTIIDSADEPRNEWIAQGLEPKAKVLRGRLERHWEQLQVEVEQQDAVIHCAASTGIPYSVTAPRDDWARNVDGTHALLEALRLHPLPTVALSSIKPYAVPDPLPADGLDEQALLVPDEPYAASKAAQSMLCMAYARSYKIPIATFRCSNLYGPAPCHGPRHGWLTWLCISAAIGRPIVVQGDGTQTRDMLYADDVYAACMVALSGLQYGLLAGEVYNLGGGAANRISVGAAAEQLRAATGVEVTYGPPRAMDDRHVYVNTAKFAAAAGWAPEVSIAAGLPAVLAWAQHNAAALRDLYAGVE